jgi:predicted nuclease of predicted toxin-antitoxin system
MKLLFDQNLSFRLCRLLAEQFPGSAHVGRLGRSKADDRTIWRYAGTNGFSLVSLDADFAEMAALLGPPPKVIWLRRGNLSTDGIGDLLRNSMDAIASFERDQAACLELY